MFDSYRHQIINDNGTNSQSKNPELDVSIADNRHLVLNVSRRINELISKVMSKLPTLSLPLPTAKNSVDPTGSGCIGSGNLGSGCLPNDDDDDSDGNNGNVSGSTITDKDDDLTATEASHGASTTAAGITVHLIIVYCCYALSVCSVLFSSYHTSC